MVTRLHTAPLTRARAFLAACLLLVLLPTVAGCGGDGGTDLDGPADELIAQARALAEKATTLEGRMDALWVEIGKIDPAKDATDGLAKLDDAEAAYARLKKRQTMLAELYDKVAKLGIGAKLGTWAGQQREIAELSARATGLLEEFVAKDKVLFSLWNQLGAAERQKLIDELEDLDARSLELRTRASELRQASKRYWEENKLGE